MVSSGLEWSGAARRGEKCERSSFPRILRLAFGFGVGGRGDKPVEEGASQGGHKNFGRFGGVEIRKNTLN